MAKQKEQGLFKRGDVWHYRYTDPVSGKQVRKSAKTTIKGHAEQKFDQEKAAAWRRNEFNEPIDWTVAELLEWALKRHLRGKPRFNEKKYESIVKAPLAVFGARKASQVKKDDVLQYMADRKALGMSNATINRELSPLRAAYLRAIDTDDMLAKTPFHKAPILKGNRRDRSASPDEKRQLMHHSTGLLHDIIEFDFDSGLRAGQIRELEWSRVDLDSRKMKVWTHKGKTGERYDYWVPIFDEALAVLKRRPRISTFVFCNEFGDQIPEEGLLTNFSRLPESLGIRDFHFHDIRHTFATDYYKRTFDLFGLSLILGHLDVKTTQIYINLTSLDLLQHRAAFKHTISTVETSNV